MVKFKLELPFISNVDVVLVITTAFVKVERLIVPVTVVTELVKLKLHVDAVVAKVKVPAIVAVCEPVKARLNPSAPVILRVEPD